ncbi:2'-5' RNA ligase family protein [Edwardsiella ictaluri]|nr:2'-5' RNA ligase family protein [Edwardsiella ictaluri]WFO08801.1 2'-5' RNA ligase family protein [Edwardsiella ictaluri]
MGAPAPPQRRAAAGYGYLGEMMGYRLGGAVLLCALAGVAWGAAPGKSYDVFIIPGSGMATLLAQTTAQLGQYHLTSLAAQGFQPHVTLYLAKYGPDALPRLKQEVAALSQRQQTFPLRLTHLNQTRGDWLMVVVENSRALQSLSDTLVRRLSPYRDKGAPLPGWVNAYPEKKAAFVRYGSPNVFSHFDPHVTLLAQSDHAALSQFMRCYGQRFGTQILEAVGLGIAETDENGQSKAVLVRYDFSVPGSGK